MGQALALPAASSALPAWVAAPSADSTGSAGSGPATLGPAAPGDDAPHKIVYQVNHHEREHQEAIFNSIGAMLKKYVDDVAIAVVVWGPPPLWSCRKRATPTWPGDPERLSAA